MRVTTVDRECDRCGRRDKGPDNSLVGPNDIASTSVINVNGFQVDWCVGCNAQFFAWLQNPRVAVVQLAWADIIEPVSRK